MITGIGKKSDTVHFSHYGRGHQSFILSIFLFHQYNQNHNKKEGWNKYSSPWLSPGIDSLKIEFMLNFHEFGNIITMKMRRNDFIFFCQYLLNFYPINSSFSRLAISKYLCLFLFSLYRNSVKNAFWSIFIFKNLVTLWKNVECFSIIKISTSTCFIRLRQKLSKSRDFKWKS